MSSNAVRWRAVFANRQEAGAALAARLSEYAGRHDVVVLALPRGGVPVAAEVARALAAPLDIFVVRKLGVPGYRELAMGAIASGGIRVLNHEVVDGLRIPESVIQTVAADEGRELARRESAYRGGRAAIPLKDRIVIVVDDGLATGATMRAAVQALRRLAPSRIIVAVPVGATRTCLELQRDADDVVCLATPEPFAAVGEWYVDFSETSDDEVRGLLRTTPGIAPAAAGGR
jgi:predicted phosphoribosyltransferase